VTILPKTRFKQPFQITAVKVGAVVNPTTGRASNEVVHATIETIEDLIEASTAARLNQIVPVPSLDVQAIVLAALWSGQLVDPEDKIH